MAEVVLEETEIVAEAAEETENVAEAAEAVTLENVEKDHLHHQKVVMVVTEDQKEDHLVLAQVLVLAQTQVLVEAAEIQVEEKVKEEVDSFRKYFS